MMNARHPDGPRSSRPKEALIDFGFWILDFGIGCQSLLTSAATRSSTIAVWLLIAYPGLGIEALHAEDEQPFGIDRRIAWTTSRVVGSPDSPLPYTVEKTFTNVPWKAPIYLTPEPDTDWLLVVQQGGEAGRPSRILRVRDAPNTDLVETFLELRGGAVRIESPLHESAVIHPFEETRYPGAN